MEKEKVYAIFPYKIDEETDIFNNTYQQLLNMDLLQGQHPLIPNIYFEKFSKGSSNKLKSFDFVPEKIGSEELELISMYQEDEVKNYFQILKKLSEEGLICELSENIKNLSRKRLDSKLQKKRINFIIPCFKDKELFSYKDVWEQLNDNNKWLKQIINFFKFLTEKGYEVSFFLKPSDFLYDEEGKVRYFLGFSHLKLKSLKKGLFAHNLKAIASLLNEFYLFDIKEKDRGLLYKQEWFEVLEGHLIKPLIYDNQSFTEYDNFENVLEAIELKDNKNRKDLGRNYTTGVFLDVANIYTPLFNNYEKIEIDFNTLLADIFGRESFRKIKKKTAVIFLPQLQQEKTLEYMISIRDKLINYGFKVLVVENQKNKAKTIVGGKEIDIDDRALLEIMDISIRELDRILLMTGDRHFFEMALKYKTQGKEVKVLSSSELSTYRGFEEKFDHDYLYNYPQSLSFSRELKS